MNLSSISREKLSLAANTIRLLSIDGVQRANSGHPGMPMGMAECALVLWLKYLNIDPSDPRWINRDRFVLSNGHGSMLLYSMLHLAGFEVSLNDLKQFRQWGSLTPGHPEYPLTPGVECTTGPLGQGISNAVGMAIGQKMTAARYNTAGHDLVSHNVFCFLGDGCLMEGVSSEASSVAGHLGLGNLIALYDDNHISIAGDTNLAFTEDVKKRYEAYGWQVLSCDGHDVEDIDRAYAEALVDTERPTLIAARTVIGQGSPNKAGTHGVHGAPLGNDEIAATRKAVGWDYSESFVVPDDVREIFSRRQEAWLSQRQEWNSAFDSWQKAEPKLAEELNDRLNLEVSDELEQEILASMGADESKPAATRKTSAAVLQEMAMRFPAVVGGSADLEPSTLTVIKDSGAVQRDDFSGRNIHYGVREHSMGSIMNGLSYYGGFVPFGSTFLTFADYMRPPIRIAALSHLRGLYIFTHDSILLGEDGPTHQPVEHLASLRCMPRVAVYRPANLRETISAYAEALRREDAPSVLVFSRQNIPPVESNTDAGFEEMRRGAYTVYETDPGTTPEIVFVASGAELPLAIESSKQFSNAQVVSMLCYESFLGQSEKYQRQVLPASAKRVVIEAGSPFGWQGMVGGDSDKTLIVGIDRFGASAPEGELRSRFGYTTDSVVGAVKDTFFR